MKDYKETLLMMQTNFPMRGNLGVNELPIIQRWEDLDIYHKVLAQNAKGPLFYLHDGPPYANGSIHVGHAVNKMLKDFIIRYYTMNGYYAPYRPGWDTHGLPIENALSKNKKINRKAMSISEFRALCANYALEQVEIQKKGFQRLGILGEWDHPYITLEKEYEAEQIRAFAKMVDRGLIFRGLKPVYWSPSSETALAEAEIEYKDVRSPSIFIAFSVVDGKNVIDNDAELVIWTTTPWTIPANLAICAGPLFEYVEILAQNRKLVVAKELLKSFTETIGIEEYTILKTIKGRELEYITYRHPLYDRISPVILGDHVTLESGTGLVHTAPGHGADDYVVGKKYNLDILCPVDSYGKMTEEAGEFCGLFYEEANKAICERLEQMGALLKLSFFTHSYPHDWRTGKPIIFRATPQWFASIANFKDDILTAISNTKWIPAWGEVRIANMIKDRAEWCISRQRVWGVPIPVFYAEDGTSILDPAIINHVADVFEKQGSNAWFDLDAKALLPEGYTHPGSPNGLFTKETDIMDVWFDSGTSHVSAMKRLDGIDQADLYLEGSDQYRGWFNSSISTAVAINGQAPYKTVITHGFTIDGNGQKMSKSLGNTIDPLAITKEYGADILRLWASSIYYQADIVMSMDLIKQISESYRKIRNTLRFLLGNLFDFNPATDLVDYAKMGEVDQYMMIKLNELTKKIHHGYQTYAFDEVYRSALNYMSNDLSAFYLDFTKDVLYIEEADSLKRRSIQSVLYHHLVDLLTLLNPILPHTCEEAYSYLPGEKRESIYLCPMAVAKHYASDAELLKKYDAFMEVRNDVLKALETARNEKIIGKSLVGEVYMHATPATLALLQSLNIDLAQVCIVSKFHLVDEELDAPLYPSGNILIKLAEGVTCSRCWQVVDHVDEDELCPRCAQILKQK